MSTVVFMTDVVSSIINDVSSSHQKTFKKPSKTAFQPPRKHIARPVSVKA